jgi:spore coat polysaccharide biosynthesis predicted glycosyltransferase SpsG
MMQIAVRADAGSEIGYGHLQRTRSVLLAVQRIHPARCAYFMRTGSDTSPLRGTGWASHAVFSDWVRDLTHWFDPSDGPIVVDSYDVTCDDLRRLKNRGYTILVFDDALSLPCPPADIVVSPTMQERGNQRRGPSGTRYLRGPSHYPLHPAFLEYENRTRSAADHRQLIVTFGGSDPDDGTTRILRFVQRLELPLETTVVLGPGYRGRAEGEFEHDAGIRFIRDPGNIAALMAEADLAIAAAGGTALELAYLGVPTLLVELSDDQRSNAAGLDRLGAAISLGPHQQLTETAFTAAFRGLYHCQAKRMALGQAGMRLVDGRGAERIARALLEKWSEVQTR